MPEELDPTSDLPDEPGDMPDIDPELVRDGVAFEPADAADPSYRQPPPGHTVRRPVDADQPAIMALYERAAVWSGQGTTGRGALRTARDLQRTWDERRNDALIVERDDLRIERDDTVVGYLEFHELMDPWTPELDLYAEGRVDPAAAGVGLGRFMLARARDRAERAAARHPDVPTAVRTTLVDPTPEMLAMFAEHGLVEQRHMLQLRIDLGPGMPAPVWPPGTRVVRATDVGITALHGAVVAAFSDHHLGATQDITLWRRVVVESGRAQLDASLVALDEHDTPVGVALCRVGADGDPGLGVVGDLGVVPAWRGQGLATALLRASFARFAELGVDRVGLEVDDVTLDGALRLYQRAGMDVVHHTVVLTSGPL